MAKQKQPESNEQHQADDERTVAAIYSDPPTELVSYETLDEAVNGADADLAAEDVSDPSKKPARRSGGAVVRAGNSASHG